MAMQTTCDRCKQRSVPLGRCGPCHLCQDCWERAAQPAPEMPELDSEPLREADRDERVLERADLRAAKRRLATAVKDLNETELSALSNRCGLPEPADTERQLALQRLIDWLFTQYQQQRRANRQQGRRLLEQAEKAKQERDAQRQADATPLLPAGAIRCRQCKGACHNPVYLTVLHKPSKRPICTECLERCQRQSCQSSPAEGRQHKPGYSDRQYQGFTGFA